MNKVVFADGFESAYAEFLHTLVCKEGTEVRMDRTGVGVYSLVFPSLTLDFRYNAKVSIPLLHAKKVSFHIVKEELLWMLRGDTNIQSLQEKNVHIWDEWADEFGDLGPVYGAQWRDWNEWDQIALLEGFIRTKPTSRRLLVSAWNVSDLNKMALPPCHVMHQVLLHNGYLSLQVYQRSADIFLGVPYNIAFYGLYLQMLSRVHGYKAGYLKFAYGDLHLYANHIDAANMYLFQYWDIKDEYPELPHLTDFPKKDSILEYESGDFHLMNYKPFPRIPAEVAV